MTSDLTDIPEEGIDFGDKYILNNLDNLQKEFELGDRTSLFTVIAICARYQAVIPEWASDAILRAEELIKTGEIKDMNSAFGWKVRSVAKRKKEEEIKKHTNKVLSLMQQHRIEGGSLDADDMLQTVADELKISRRIVEHIYKEKGHFIKEMPRKLPEAGATFGFAQIELPPIRRDGRAVLKD